MSSGCRLFTYCIGPSPRSLFRNPGSEMSTAVVPASYEVSLVAIPDQEDDVLEVSDFDDYRQAVIFFWDRVKKIEPPHPGFLRAGSVATRAGELRFEVVLPDGSRVLRACHWGHLRQTSSGQKIEWREPKDNDLLRIYLVMPDIGGVYAWLQDGTAAHFEDDFPDEKGLPELEDRFEDWQGKFEGSASNIDPEANRDFDWESFHALGIQLACELKDLLGDRASIFYSQPYEDPNLGEREFLAIVA